MSTTGIGRAAAATAVIAMLGGVARARADPPLLPAMEDMLRARWLEAHQGISLQGLPEEKIGGPFEDAVGGLKVDILRRAPPLYFGWGIVGQLAPDWRNVEDAGPIGVIGTGPLGGVLVDLVDRMSLYAGARLEWVNAWGWPEGDWPATRDVHDGVRGGPGAAVALWMGRLLGHPFGLCFEIEWLYHRVGETRGGAWGGSFGFAAQLRPQPEDYGVYDWTPSWARPK